jgi:hypothetical protein
LFSRPCDSDGSTRIKKNKQMVSKSHCRERKRLEIESKEASNHKMEIPRHVLRNQRKKTIQSCRNDRSTDNRSKMVDDKTHRTFPSHQFENKKKSFDTKIEEMKTSTNQMHKKRNKKCYILTKKRKMSVYKFREREKLENDDGV